MEIIRHRVNRIEEIQSLNTAWGAEIDLRSVPQQPGKLQLSHDPWQLGDDFEKWLKEFSSRGIQGPLILNTKEDGLESRILELLKTYQIRNYFFLDTALPTLVKWTIQEGVKNFAVRVSSYEPLALAESFRGKADWAWVDCFGGRPVAASLIAQLKSQFKICLVSPEVVGKPIKEIANFLLLKALADAICTKSPDSWCD